MNAHPIGKLYGIGVGPGDPDLIPVKAVRILQRVDVVFAASSTKNQHSQAVAIAKPHLPSDADIRLLPFPMTKDLTEKEVCWERHARLMIDVLTQGQSAAFLTLGDSLTYATYGYILKAIKRLAPDIPIETLPGITSYQAAAARVNLPLVEGQESLLVLSGVEGGDQLRKMSECAENVVFLKAYRNTGDIIASLDEADMLDSSVAVANVGRDNEEVIEDIRHLEARPPGYWTLIIAKRNGAHEAPLS